MAVDFILEGKRVPSNERATSSPFCSQTMKSELQTGSGYDSVVNTRAHPDLRVKDRRIVLSSKDGMLSPQSGILQKLNRTQTSEMTTQTQNLA